MFTPNTATSTGNSNTSSTSSTMFPGWTQQAGQNLAGSAWGMLSPHLQASPYHTAGQNADQQNAFDRARHVTGNAFGNNANLTNATNALANGQAGRMQAAQAEAAQLDPNAFKDFMNPFLDSVGKSTLGNMRSEYRNADAGLAGQYAASQAFGGSGEAIARGQLARGYNQNAGSAINNLMSQGYDRATATAMANTQMEQQANMANAAFQQQANMANSQLDQALPLMFDRLQSSQQGRQSDALQQLLGVGNQQQQFAQGVIDKPLEYLQMLAGLTPNVYNQVQTGTSTGTSSSEAPTGGPSMAQQLLGLGGSILSAKGSGTKDNPGKSIAEAGIDSFLNWLK
jgi:hypothetical protein